MNAIIGVLVVFAGFIQAVSSQNGASFELKINPTEGRFIKPQGSAALFTCEVSNAQEGEVRIQWQDNSKRDIPEDPSKRIYVESTDETSDSIFSKKLHISSIQNADAGSYYCVANTTAGQQIKSVELGIFQDITFDHVPSPQHPVINTNAVITCIVSGFPKPEVSWRYRGKPIETGKRYTKLDHGLQIANITPDDDGTYICRADVDSDGRYDQRLIIVAVRNATNESGFSAFYGHSMSRIHFIGCLSLVISAFTTK